MMKAKFTKTALGIAFGLCAAAAPGYCTNLYPSLAFNGTTGTINDNGQASGSYITDFDISLGTLSLTGSAINNPSYTATNLALIYEGGGLQTTVTGVTTNESTAATSTAGYLYLVLLSVGSFSGSLSNLAAGQILVSWSLAGIDYSSGTSSTPYYSASPVGSHNPLITLNASTTLSESAAFLTDLYGTATSGTIDASGFGAGSTIMGTGSGTSLGNGITQYSENSSPINFTLTPEPVSFLMLGSGLLAIGFFGRKRLMAR